MALMVLMQFFVNASGCKGRITPEMSTFMEHTVIIRRMTEEFDEVWLPHRKIEKWISYLCLFPGKWRISSDNVWTAVEEISRELL